VLARYITRTFSMENGMAQDEPIQKAEMADQPSTPSAEQCFDSDDGRSCLPIPPKGVSHVQVRYIDQGRGRPLPLDRE
jgi:hypothetical protein